MNDVNIVASGDSVGASGTTRQGPFFEDVTVGMELPALKKRPITRLQLAKYAAATGDFNPSHVDEDIARDVGGMKGVFAHGMIGMGFIGEMLTNWLWDRPLRRFSTRATVVVRPGDVLECYGKVVRKWVEEVDNLIEIEVGARNQREEVTHTGRAIALLPTRPLMPRTHVKQPYLLQHRVIG
jgi:acyl dehydratase